MVECDLEWVNFEDAAVKGAMGMASGVMGTLKAPMNLLR